MFFLAKHKGLFNKPLNWNLHLPLNTEVKNYVLYGGFVIKSLGKFKEILVFFFETGSHVVQAGTYCVTKDDLDHLPSLSFHQMSNIPTQETLILTPCFFETKSQTIGQVGLKLVAMLPQLPKC